VSLTADNPQGRLDVLAFRIIDRIAERECPEEWKKLKPGVELLLERLLAPKGEPAK